MTTRAEHIKTVRAALDMCPCHCFGDGGTWICGNCKALASLDALESQEPLGPDEHGECPNCANPPHFGPCKRKCTEASTPPAPPAAECAICGGPGCPTCCEGLRAELEIERGINRRGERAIGALRALAHRLGWNGVENSKILEVFLDNYISELRLKAADAVRTRDALANLAVKHQRASGELADELRRAVDALRQAQWALPSPSAWLADYDAKHGGIK